MDITLSGTLPLKKHAIASQVKDKLLPHQGHTFAASSIGQSVFVLQAEPNPGWIQVPRKTGLPLQHEAILSPKYLVGIIWYNPWMHTSTIDAR